MASANVKEGELDFNVEDAGKPCKTWYKLFGDLSSKTRPLIALHGGPGVGHNYLLSLQDLASHHGIPVILYDQLGCGNSTLLPEKKGDASFWTVSLFLSELANLVRKLDISSYSLFGNSWGGMLAAEHAATRPAGLHSVIIADSPADMGDWVRAANGLRAKLPPDVQETLERCEREEKTDSKEYHDAVEVFYRRHVCRIWPWPQDVQDSFALLDKDPTVYHTMNGPSEFHVIGSLKTWSIKGRLSRTEVPAMLLNGTHDEATDEVVQPFFDEISRVRWFTFAASSHMPHWEEREHFMEVLSKFLKS